MSEKPKIRVVRCPKCEKLLSELPKYAVYQCGGCGAFLQAKNKPSLDDGSSQNTGIHEGSELLTNGDDTENVIGEIERGRISETSLLQNRESNMANKSPIRTRQREFSRSPMRGNDCPRVSKSPVRSSRNEDVRKSPTRGDNAFADFHRINRSPERSTREIHVDESGGFDRSPVRTIDGGLRRSPVRDDGLSLNVNARDERVGAWVDQTGFKEEVRGYGDGRVFGLKTSFNEWLHDDGNSVDQPEMHRASRSPRRGQKEGSDEALTNCGPNLKRDNELGHREGWERPLEFPTHDQILEGGYGPDRDRGYSRFQGGGYARPRSSPDQLYGERGKFGVIHGNPQNVGEQRRILSYPDKGPSAYSLDSSYGYDELRHLNDPSSTGFNSARDSELEQSELLRKYFELQEQLKRTGRLLEEPKERFNQRVPPVETSHAVRDDYVQHEILRLRRVPVNMNSRKPPCFTYAHDPTFVNAQDTEYMDSIYLPPQSVTNQIPLHRDPVITNMSRRTSYHSHPRLSSCDYMIPHPSMDSDQDPHDMYGKNYHDPSCSCSHCYVNNWQTQPQAPRRYNPRMSSFPEGNVSINHDVFVPMGYNRRMTDCKPSSHKRAGSDCSSDTSSSAYRRPRRVLPIDANSKVYFPIAGGAPFIFCHKCFQLLKLPRKVIAMKMKTPCKLKCGVCSATLSLDLGENRSLALSKPLSSDPVLNESGHKTSLDCGSTAGSNGINFESSDFDASGYSFQYTASESSANKRGLSSSSSSSGEHNHDSQNVRTDLHSNTLPVPPNTNLVRPPPGSPLRDHLDYSTIIAVSKPETGNRTYNQDERIADPDTPRRNSLDSVGAETETEVHSHELPFSSLSQDSEDNSRDETRVAHNKSNRSSVKSSSKLGLWGISNRSGHHDSNEEADVFINGQPIPYDQVKRAEKLAGTISPGNYWYDFKAGFWGVMGDQCLGIIPPYIQEFSYPLSVNCSGGNTCVYVNNRELHQNDLDILAKRGLPRTRHKFYVVDKSGKVLDEDGGRFVVNLGKLAPSVEKNGQGFGMHFPDALDD